MRTMNTKKNSKIIFEQLNILIDLLLRTKIKITTFSKINQTEISNKIEKKEEIHKSIKKNSDKNLL